MLGSAHVVAAFRTTLQIAFAVKPFPETRPTLFTWRNIAPEATPADVVQRSMASFTHCGSGTVRTRPPFPTRSAITQCSSLCSMSQL
jgi:hypothetical protein